MNVLFFMEGTNKKGEERIIKTLELRERARSKRIPRQPNKLT